MLPGVNDITEGVLAFLRPRRKENGGYGATPTLPATIEDTYHALCILHTLGIKADLAAGEDKSLQDYLFRMKETGWKGTRTFFQLLSTCCLAGVAISHEKAATFVKRRLTETKDLVERYYCARIVREVLDAATITGMEMAGGLSRIPWRDATELCMILYLLNGTQTGEEPSRRRDLIGWLQACQNYDGGFGFLPGTTSFVENCHTCLRGLALLDAVPRDPGACRAFILACQTATGGFARINRAAAFLDSTWHAIAALSLLPRGIHDNSAHGSHCRPG